MRIDNHTHIGVEPLFYLQGWSPFCLDLARLFIQAEGCGIDRFVVFPFVSYMALDQAALRAKRIALAAGGGAPYAFENRRLRGDIARCPPELRERLWPFLIADPGREPEAQVREWERLPTDPPARGIKIQGTIIQSKVATLLDTASCMLDYAEEHDLPFVIHSSIRPDDEWSQCADLLRVAESRPGVRFVLAHSCRYHLPSLQRLAAIPNAWFDCSAHLIHCRLACEDHPAVAVPSERFPTDYADPVRVLRDLAAAFPGKLIWGSDTPFHAIDYEHVQVRFTYRDEIACLDALPPDVQDEVSHRNTLAWLGIAVA